MIKNNKVLFYWLPVFIWLEIIFLLSSIPGSLLPKLPSLCNFWAHRIVHFSEYSILGVLLIRAYSYLRSRIGIITIIFLSMVIFLASSFDEWHQSFVPGRNCELIDVVFDTICGTIALTIYVIWLKMRRFK